MSTPTAADHGTPFINRLARTCPLCDQPMQVLQLAGHYGAQLQIELCAPCHVVWFDTAESVQLAGAGLLGLVDAMARAQRAGHVATNTRPHCPVCRTDLKLIQNKTRFGANVQHDCAMGHGTLQTFAQFLAQKGYVRRIEYADIPALQATHGTALERLSCVNCGAPVPPLHALTQPAHSANAQELKDECAHCGTSLNMVDLARLVRAIDRHGAAITNEDSAAYAQRLQQVDAAKHSIACVHCGGQVQPTLQTHCDHCGGAVIISSLAQANHLLQPLLPALQARHKRVDPFDSAYEVDQRLQSRANDAADAFMVNNSSNHHMRNAAVKAAKHLMTTGEEHREQQRERLERAGLLGIERVLTAFLGGGIICAFVWLWFGFGWAVLAGLALLAGYVFNLMRQRGD